MLCTSSYDLGKWVQINITFYKTLGRLCSSPHNRTAVQGFCSYMAINLPNFWDGSGHFGVALEALFAGAIAAGISAIWKTAAAELITPEESEASMIEQDL